MEPFDNPQIGADLEAVIMDIQVILQFIGLLSTQVFETLYVYRELYLSKHTGRDLAKAILAAEAGEKVSYGVFWIAVAGIIVAKLDRLLPKK